MSLADEIKSFRDSWVPNQGPDCCVKGLMAVLPKKDAEALMGLIADRRVYATDVHRFIQGQAEDLDEDDPISIACLNVRVEPIRKCRRDCRCGLRADG